MNESICKIIKWAFENGITISVMCHKEQGIKDQIHIGLCKNGKCEEIRLFDWDDLDKKWLQNVVQDRALNLTLTRLVL